jgi:hypothetical protein
MYRYTFDTETVKRHQECFLTLATAMVGKQIRQTNGHEVFNSIFGISVHVCSVLWFLLNSYLQIEMDKYPVHLLWALHFLKNYTKEEVLRPIMGNLHIKH